jgi:hypothetical protein
MITNASARRFLVYQKQLHPDAPPRLWDRYSIYVSCVEAPSTFKEWMTR